MRSILASLVRRHATAVAYLALFAALGRQRLPCGRHRDRQEHQGRHGHRQGHPQPHDCRWGHQGELVERCSINENGLGQVSSAAPPARPRAPRARNMLKMPRLRRTPKTQETWVEARPATTRGTGPRPST